MIAQRDWYEVVPFANGVSMIHEPWIKPFFRCNMWHVRGRDFDLLVDTGLGHFPLRANVPMLRSGKPLVCVASHAHFDHIGSHHEFEERWIHAAEAEILADPRPEWTLAAGYADEAMFIAPPAGWDTNAYRVKPAPATKLLCVGRSEFQTPSPDRFIRDDDATLQQQLLGQAQAQREPKVQPDRMGDDLLRETVTLVADGRFLHPTVSTHHSLTGGLRDNARRIYTHVNNTNSALMPDSPARAAITAAGWEIATDGMEVVL